MPIYAYRCASCGHAQDVLQKLSDPILTVCPACGALSYRKQLTSAGFQLKGSGWYVTDFRNPAAAKAGAADGAQTTAVSSGDGSSDGNAGANGASSKDAPPSSPTPSPAAGDSKPASSSTSPSPAPSSGKPAGDH